MEQIGKYKILAHIGHGAMGSVEKAEAPDGTVVAIKTLFPQFVYEDEYVRRFKREAALAKKLSHPNIVKILEVGEDRDGRCLYMAMEYIDGKTLAEYMHDKGMASAAVKRSGRMNEKAVPGAALHRCHGSGSGTSPAPTKITAFTAKETIKIIRQLAGALQAASDIGLLHRDIKPQNILLDKKGSAKLLDFGLAKDTEALASMLSITGQSIGTPPYMSPEQHEGSKKIDMRSDLYSLGCTAYHMLAGKPPFPAASASARRHCAGIPTPVHTINPDCPLNLSQVIDRLLAKKPENRHQDPMELIEDLNRVECGETPLKLYKAKKHNPLRNCLAAAAAAVIVAGCFIGWNFYRRSNAVTVIKEVMSDTQQIIVKHDFDSAKNVLDNIIFEYVESTPEQLGQAEVLRVKLIARHGKWIAGEAASERWKEAGELTRAESTRKRKLQSSLAAYSKTLCNGPPKAQPWIIPGLGMKFVYVAPGTFNMGSNNGDGDEKPVHRVSISNGYLIGKYEVTQSEYQSITGTNPSYNKGGSKPVETVNWNDAVEFCKKLNKRERSAGRLPSNYEYRLPTEAEWEFAARGGTRSRGHKYSGSNNINSVAWYWSNSGKQTHKAGTKSPNELGIYDMSGNVWEWCGDWKDRYSSSAQVGPTGPSTGSYRVHRGGSWNSNDRNCRVANRRIFSPGCTFNSLGFRVVLARSSG